MQLAGYVTVTLMTFDKQSNGRRTLNLSLILVVISA